MHLMNACSAVIVVLSSLPLPPFMGPFDQRDPEKAREKALFVSSPFFRHPRSVLDAYSVSEVWLGLSRSSRADPTTQGVAGWLGPTFHW